MRWMQTAYVPIWNKLPQKCYQIQIAFDFGQYMQLFTINWTDQTKLWPNKCSIEIEHN